MQIRNPEYRSGSGLSECWACTILSIMESNFDVSPTEASQNLAAVEADQTAIRTAAVPPRWYIALVSICIGALFALFAVPDSYGWLLNCIKILIIAGLLTALIYWTARQRSVRPGRAALFTSVPRAIPIVVVFIVVIVLTCVEPLPVPWWGHLCIGICIGVGTYFVAQWSWRNWAESPSRRGTK